MRKANNWYTPMLEGEGDTTLRMKQILMTDIKLVEILENNRLPKGYDKKKAKELGVLRIRKENIDELIEEIRWRGQFDKEFDINRNETMTYTNMLLYRKRSLLRDNSIYFIVLS